MRNQLKNSFELDIKFSFSIARTQQQLSEAYRILHDSYLEMGYSKQHISGMRIVKYFALPSTTTLVAQYDGNVVGTISIIRRGSFGLPMDSVFNLSHFIDRNEVIAEVSSLAVDSKFRQKRGALFLPLLKFFWEYVERFMNLDSIVITVNPSMSDFYEAFLGFKRLKNAVVSDYSFANGHPGVGLYLNIKTAPALFKKLYDHKPIEKNLYHYFVNFKLSHFLLPERTFKKSSDPVMTPEMLTYFFVKKSTVFAELTVQEKMGLISSYPKSQYNKALPAIKRKNIRYSVNITAKLDNNEEIDLTILEVSLDGICVASKPFRLNGILEMNIPIAKDRISKVKGEVCWKDLERNIFGIHLLKIDSHWNDFVSYLDQDFEGINSFPEKKAS